MTLFLVVSCALLCVLILFLGFLLLGTLRAVALLGWRLEQLEATTPSRLGRRGLKPGVAAPAFALPDLDGRPISLADFAGRKLLLVFVQSGCGPCQQVVPELNRLHSHGDLQVLAVFSGGAGAARQWAQDAAARFGVLVQEDLTLSRRYEAFATPFAFLIDGQGTIASRGLIRNRHQVHFVLAQARRAHTIEDSVPVSAGAVNEF